jgi:hypothetical protein
MPIIKVRGGRTGRGPLTWGQRAMWRIMLPLGDQVHFTNVASWTALPEHTGVRSALDWVGSLAVAYDSVRTRIVPEGEDWVQVLDGAGELDVEIVPGTPADLAETAAAERLRLKQTVFRADRQWPIRFSLVADGDRALALVWAAAHVVSDLWGRWAFDAAASRPGAAFDAGVQPLDRAAFERSPAGSEVDRKAIAHYRRQLATAGADPFPAAARPPHDGFRSWHGFFTSPALAAGLDAQALAHGTTTAAVLRAAVNSALADEAGVDSLTMTMLAGNRLDPRTRAAFGTFTQFVPTTLRDTGAPWPAVLGRAAVANLQAMQRGSYDPRSLDRLEAELTGAGQHLPDFTMTLDDGRRPAAAAPPRCDPAGASRGKVDWAGGSDGDPYTFFLWVAGDRDAIAAEVMVDSTRVGPQQAERILARAEEKLLAAADS